jgi:flagellin
MSSILTNASAMVALQTLKTVNSNLQKTQSEVATGKKIADAKDNAATWAISKVMEADVKGFKTISDSLAMGASTVAVARKAAETVAELLTDMKGMIVAAQESNVDRAKIQADINVLKDQINTVVGAAQFNGQNLVSSGGSVNVLSSLNRDSAGNVTSSSIQVNRQNLSAGGYTSATAFDTTNTTGVAADSGDSFSFSLDANGGTADNGTIEIVGANYAAGDSINLRIGERSVSYTVTAEDIAATTPSDVIALKLKSAIESSGANVSVDYDSGTPGTLVVTNEDGTDSIGISGQYKNASSGGLALMSTIDVVGSTALSLSNIETMLQTAFDSAAAFGSVERRIEIQSSFVSKLSDSLKSGIGSLVDADMEETSARLQALQVQQQLGIQALSIANQAPQNILSLFR